MDFVELTKRMTMILIGIIPLALRFTESGKAAWLKVVSTFHERSALEEAAFEAYCTVTIRPYLLSLRS